jgi:glycosyltransferase involved in cell wall biosynthesis
MVVALVSDRPRVLLVSPPGESSFVAQDFRCLAERYDAVHFAWRGIAGIPRLLREIARADAILIWFAARHAVPTVIWARLLRVPVATIVGGYEVAWLPEIPYGIPPGSVQHRIVRAILHYSNQVLTVSQITDQATRNLLGETHPPIQLIHNAIDTDHFCVDPAVARRTILTVAHFKSTTVEVKGLRLFWEVAEAMPDEEFVAVGPAHDDAGRALVGNCPPNLRWLGPLYGPELLLQYQQAKVYFQGSLHESFSVATVEAMACGCLPVVAPNGALPEVAGDSASYLEALTPEAAVRAIRDALTRPEVERQKARARVVERFAVSRRQEALFQVIDRLIADGRQTETAATRASQS